MKMKLWQSIVSIIITFALIAVAVSVGGCQNDTELVIRNSAKCLMDGDKAPERSSWAFGTLR